MNNAQSRKWTLVINHPLACGFTHDVLCETLMKFFPDYFCMADEIAATGTFHTHIFLYSHSPIRFSTLKNRFPVAHIEKAYGSAKDNREYILKSGKWEQDKKAETSVESSFYEYGTLPEEREENNPKMSRLIASVRDGKRTTEIIDDTPEFAFRIREIDVLRQTLLSERYNDRIACYTKVYLTSNIPLDEQYKDVQIYHPETWRAFLRRIHNIVEYHPDGTTTERSFAP